MERPLWVFFSKNAPQIFHLKKDINTTSQNQLSLSTYYTKQTEAIMGWTCFALHFYSLFMPKCFLFRRIPRMRVVNAILDGSEWLMQLYKAKHCSWILYHLLLVYILNWTTWNPSLHSLNLYLSLNISWYQSPKAQTSILILPLPHL